MGRFDIWHINWKPRQRLRYITKPVKEYTIIDTSYLLSQTLEYIDIQVTREKKNQLSYSLKPTHKQ